MAGGRRRIALVVALTAVLALVVGCIRPPEPDPAIIRTTPPPWEAPRDAISYIEAAGLEALPMETPQGHKINMVIVVDGFRVTIPANVGIDRLRAQRAVVHTHDTTNQVWLEGKGADQVTLGQFFAVWGVRFDEGCLGAACGQVTVTADDQPVSGPVDLPLAGVDEVEVWARS